MESFVFIGKKSFFSIYRVKRDEKSRDRNEMMSFSSDFRKIHFFSIYRER